MAQRSASCNTSSTEAIDILEDALSWLRRLLIWHIEVTRAVYGSLADDTYRGLYVPSAEVDLLADEARELPANLVQQRVALAEERVALEAQMLAASPASAMTPFFRLARLFGLTSFECDVLLLALAPELDLRFERIYAYIQDDVSRRRPSVDLALRLFCTMPRERLALQASFEHDARLVRQRLIALFEDGQRRPPLLGRFIKLDDRVLAELRGRAVSGQSSLDALIAPFCALVRPQRTLADLVLPTSLMGQLRSLDLSNQVLALEGGYGSGRSAVATALCAEQRRPMIKVALGKLVSAVQTGAPLGGAGDVVEVMQRIVREARLRGAAILWCDASTALADEASPALREALLAALDEPQLGCMLSLSQPWEARGALSNNHYLRLELPELTYSERELVWQRQPGVQDVPDGVWHDLASTFRLNAGQIRDAARMAGDLARWRGGAGGVQRADLYAACHAQSSGRLARLAHKVRIGYGWEDIVLPVDQVGQLREIALQVRHRRTVLEGWGFDKHLAMGKGLNVLFAGPSGTGKTMAAEVIARDLGLELYKVDLSTMVSKYIGETEKNLDKVFTAAREANAILFFDEADAIFGKRSEVKDAHDRYANIEVGYLLQKMEEYDGVVILATNLRKNLDEAFVRRLHMSVDFPFPEEADRVRIWSKVFPSAAPLAADLDLTFLARRFRLSGGNIRNVALLAAYLAVEDGAAIGTTHVMRAVRREYQKMGKLVDAAEFDRYIPAK